MCFKLKYHLAGLQGQLLFKYCIDAVLTFCARRIDENPHLNWIYLSANDFGLFK